MRQQPKTINLLFRAVGDVGGPKYNRSTRTCILLRRLQFVKMYETKSASYITGDCKQICEDCLTKLDSIPSISVKGGQHV